MGSRNSTGVTLISLSSLNGGDTLLRKVLNVDSTDNLQSGQTERCVSSGVLVADRHNEQTDYSPTDASTNSWMWVSLSL